MKKILILLSFFFGMMALDGCTDLEEEVLDESLTGGATAGEILDGAALLDDEAFVRTGET